MLVRLAAKSLIDRKSSVVLTCIAMTISIFVLLGVEHIRKEAKASFSSTVSGADLIVGARSGQLNLLLYSVFRLGSPVNNISWNSYQQIASKPEVEWTIPISLGDSHQGFRVLGTTSHYFEYFNYGNKQPLNLAQGKAFTDVFEVVLGADVASTLKYEIGDKIVLAHGIGETSFTLHKEQPFKISGILARTGTPVDQTVHVSLQGIEAIHSNGNSIESDLKPTEITAFMLGLKSRMSTFQLQREVNEYGREPLMAILPGVALSELWRMMSMLESTLRLISALVFAAALLGLAAIMAASIRERKNEIHLLRIIGASPRFLFVLFEMEAILISVVSILSGSALLYLSLFVAQEFLSTQLGLHMGKNLVTVSSGLIIASTVFATILVAAIPAFRAYSKAKHVESK
jgi:putative ABC transport system permease protein